MAKLKAIHNLPAEVTAFAHGMPKLGLAATGSRVGCLKGRHVREAGNPRREYVHGFCCVRGLA